MLVADQKISPKVFRAIQQVDIDVLSTCQEEEIKPILPCLVRMSLIAPLDQSEECAQGRKTILRMLSAIELVNSLVALLSIDFHALEIDVRKEQQLRQKVGNNSQTESILIQNLPAGLALEFERSDPTRRLRLVLSELLFIMSQAKESRNEYYVKSSELLDNEVYLEEVSDVMCIALAELPGLLPITDVAEALLHVKYGPWLLCRLVANAPDSYMEVCNSLILSGEKQDEDTPVGRIRLSALKSLCALNPSQALVIRQKCVEYGRMPGLTMTLSLSQIAWEMECSVDKMDCNSPSDTGDLVSFTSGLLLGNEQATRTWFSLFVRSGQKKKRESSSAALQSLCEELLERLQGIVSSSNNLELSPSQVVVASAFLRLYCAFRGIAGLRFNDDEVSTLVQLLTMHPPKTAAGSRFVSLSLCMLIACPSLIQNVDHERKCIEWIQWLIQETDFESHDGLNASFGEMLLLMAIHFHGNQLSAICDLVCSTLGMKISIKHNNMSRMKHIFVQEIFTEQIVTAHAVRVPVTHSLSAKLQGYLPIHCIYQLLKSRAFTKHKVPIKDWIYRQICDTCTPLHPVLPALIEVYVNSIIMPPVKCPTDHTNEPISEQEILRVFDSTMFDGFVASKSSQLESDKFHAIINWNGLKKKKTVLPSQLLLLYYVLLYEDVRLNNMRLIMTNNRKVHHYSEDLFTQIPIRYLLQQAQRNQHDFPGLYPPLLKLLATHYPQLCTVEDTFEDSSTSLYDPPSGATIVVSNSKLLAAYDVVVSCPVELSLLFQKCLTLPPSDLWAVAPSIIQPCAKLLGSSVPRKLQEIFKTLWLRLNTIFPRRLWVMTVNALFEEVQKLKLTQEDLTLDPLYVLRCDRRVYRCPPMLCILLKVLEAYLAASRIYLAHHILNKPILEKSCVTSDLDREELKNALIATQESAAVQILLEACLPNSSEQEDTHGHLNNLREVRGQVCSYIHQVFIADPNLAKLVHFQGYPHQLLPVTVTGIPSMHICMDFLPELLQQPDVAKQTFAIDLQSYLCIQYALPKSMSIARLCINTMSTLLGVLPCELRNKLFQPILPSLVRFCTAFPPLCDDAVSVLLQLGRVSLSGSSLEVTKSLSDSLSPDRNRALLSDDELSLEVLKTFKSLVDTAVLRKDFY